MEDLSKLTMFISMIISCLKRLLMRQEETWYIYMILWDKSISKIIISLSTMEYSLHLSKQMSIFLMLIVSYDWVINVKIIRELKLNIAYDIDRLAYITDLIFHIIKYYYW